MSISAEDIYGALTRKEWQTVRDMCNQHPKGPFLKISRAGDSVLQKALYAGEVQLVQALLEDANERFSSHPHEFDDKLMGDVNILEYTTLHVAATQDSCISAAVEICRYADQLLFARNSRGEFPIFSAVRYGHLKMFKFLNAKITEAVPDEDWRLYFCYRVSNERESYTILHTAIYNEHFELALYIARTIPSLIGVKDHQQMTGLHMLAMNSAAFRHKYWKCMNLLLPSPFRHFSEVLYEDAIDQKTKEDGEVLHRDLTDHKTKDVDTSNAIMPSEDFTNHKVKDITSTTNDIMSPKNATNHKVDDAGIIKVGSSFTSLVPNWPYWNKFKKEFRKYQAAQKLCSFLVSNDTDWIDKLETTAVAEAAGYSADYNPSTPSAENLNNANEELVKPPTPLILATKFGCLDIALQIIKKHPQTVEQVDREYGSILHLAIKYRRAEIFDEVVKMEMQMRRLVRLQDKDENSILHMVALNTTKVKAKNGTDATSTRKPKAKSPLPWDAEQLNHESRSPAFILQDDLLLFERVEDILKTHYHKIPNKDLETPDQLFAAKKEPLREEAQDWMKRTAENCSIVAVLIATVAFAAAYTVPGGSNDDGSPVLLNQAFFLVFTVTDVLSLASTLTAVVVFLSILCSSYRLEDFKETLPKSLMFGISCLIFSLAMMMLSFAATIILMIKNRQQWTKIALYAVAFLPVTVLVATYLPFYVPLMRTYHYTIDKVKSILPNFTCQKSSLSKTKKPTTWADPSIQV